MTTATTITCEDWRNASSTEVRALLEKEARVWRSELGWDVRDSWRVIEPARAAGTLPGFIARDAAGRVLGWSWFLQHRGTLQVAALVAEQPGAIETLVDAAVTSDAARSSTAQVWSMRGGSPALWRALKGAGLSVEPYLYMNKELIGVSRDAIGPAAVTVREWRPADHEHAPGLFAEAYNQAGHIRAFAPDGSIESWQAYLRTLFQTSGCGVLLPAATLVADRDGLMAAIVTTAIDRERGVAHLAQIAVSPHAQGQGLARTLLRYAMSESEGAGLKSMTLLVAEGNTAARRLYDTHGFQQTATFTIAAG